MQQSIKDPLGFVVSNTPDVKQRGGGKKPFKIKVYAIIAFLNKKSPNGKVCRFRLYKQFGNFSTHKEAAEEASKYAKLHGFPYAYYLKHNKQVPSLIYQWYFKEPPIKIFG